MIYYKNLLKKLLFIFSIILISIILVHIICTSLYRNLYYYNYITMYTLSAMSLSFIICFICYFVFCAKKTNKLYSILNDSCDANKAIELTLLELDNVYTLKNKTALNIFLVSCYYRNNNTKEAFDLLKRNEVFKLEIPINYKILWYHNFIMISIKNFEEDYVQHFRTYLEKLKTLYPKKVRSISSYLIIQEKYMNFINKEYMDLEKYYEEELRFAVSNLEKVIYNYHLAIVKSALHKDYSLNKEFVINNGNTLIYVSEVEGML